MDSRRFRGSSVVTAACIVLAVAIGGARAETTPAITVTGIGEARITPNRLEITTSVSGHGELAGDAQVKYRDALKRAEAALQALHIDGLEVKGQGFGLGNSANPAQAQMLMAMGRAPATTQPSFNISERVNVTVDQVDKLEPQKVVTIVAHVIDAIKDAGLTVGGGDPTNIFELQLMQQGRGTASGVVFRLTDPVQARNQAYEKAVADARAKATEIASLTGIKLGGIIAVVESEATPANDPQTLLRTLYGGRAAARGDEVSSTTFQPILVSKSLTVTFAIEK